MEISSFFPMEGRSDGELASMVRGGDSDAFSALSSRYMPAMRSGAGRCAKLCGADTEDFMQDALMALFRAAKGYDPTAGTMFSTYAISSINNAMTAGLKRYLRNARRHAGVNIDDIDEWQLQSRFRKDIPIKPVEDMYLDGEDIKQRELQIETLLSNFERRVLRLYLAGYSYRQISELLLISTKAVDNALQRVRRKLRAA